MRAVLANMFIATTQIFSFHICTAKSSTDDGESDDDENEIVLMMKMLV